MAEADFALSRDQRDEIMRAVNAIERQLKEMAGKPQGQTWQTLWVISMNLTIIQTHVIGLPRASSN